MKNKLELVLNKNKETVSSLELVKYLNKLREIEYKHREAKSLLTNAEIKRNHYVELKHKTMLSIIGDEFEEEIGEQKIFPTYYVDTWNRKQVMFNLTLEQVKQVLARESKYVRRAIIKYIEVLEKELQGLKNKQHSDWLKTRENGKVIRRNLTDMIQELIPYAIRQGCSNVKFFYSTYSKLTNKVVGIENGTRDIISIQELFRVSTVEDVFNEIIKQGMEKDLNYKEIYQLCKKKGDEFKKVFGVDLIE